MAEEKFDEEKYRAKNKELLSQLEILGIHVRLGGFGAGKELGLSELRKKLTKLEKVDKEELQRIINDSLDRNEGLFLDSQRREVKI